MLETEVYGLGYTCRRTSWMEKRTFSALFWRWKVC